MTQTTMSTTKPSPADASIQTLSVVKESQIGAPVDVVWESVLEELGPASIHCKEGMIFEARPGGRWYRELAEGQGHLWGHVQVIKPPKLLEIMGPLFMSYPAISHVQYRLTEEGGGTKLKLTHRAIGLIDPEHRKGVNTGWGQVIANIEKIVARRTTGR